MTQPKKRQKKIKLKDIAKQYKEVTTLSSYLLNAEEGIVILYYKIFDNKRIELLIKEASKSLQYDAEHNLNFFNNNDEVFIQYIFFLILKYMTNLYDEIPASLDEQIPIFNQLISIGLFEDMFNNVFDPNEVSKVLERIGSFALLATQMAEQEANVRSEIKQTVQHPILQKRASESDAEI